MAKKTLVVGASENTSRMSAKVIKLLRDKDHEIIALGRKDGSINEVDIISEKILVDDVDTVTMYVNPQNQSQFTDYILSLKPKRVICNPGSENHGFAKALRDNGIETLNACTMVMLSTDQF